MRIFEALRAFQQTAAMRTAIDLDIFSIIGSGSLTAGEIAAKCSAAERGVRILCDYLATDGFLIKQGAAYACSPEAALFLDRKSPACIASAAAFLAGDEQIYDSKTLIEAVRRGGGPQPDESSIKPDNPMWVLFARAMEPMAAMAGRAMAETVAGTGPLKVLDIAAGHGIFGISIAQRNPQAQIVAVDWAAVLDVAKENATKAGVADRVTMLPGSAFDVDYGTGYDLVLITNFLHHFNAAENEKFLRKVRAALKPGGKAITLEFCPNEDRITPTTPARFSLTMLAATPEGDAYTFRELESMFRNAGFSSSTRQLLPSDQSVIVSVW
jgi:ubiquinone/menaquinone biosynthesis C-methylase UbiE